ncbi:MAG: VOC family protein [Saprospiraceae bacterium]|nr:VOC family protein [Saprospiraceae bacterium]
MGGISTKKQKKRTTLKDYISWFEIPAINFQNAVNFYSQIFDIKMQQVETGEYLMAFFPTTDGIGGAIVKGPGSLPNDTGPLLYLNGGKDLNDILEQVPKAGGRIVLTKTLIAEDSGYFAIFIDTEGNKLALHSKK